MTVRDPSVLTCQEVVELVTEFLGDALPSDDRIRIEQHLLVCPPCTLYLGQVRATIALTGDLLGELPPPTAIPGAAPRTTPRTTAETAPEAHPELLALFREWKKK